MSAESQLADLDAHWGDVYAILHVSGGRWLAWWRADRAETLTADTAGELRALIRHDYDVRTVPPPETPNAARPRGARAGGLRLVDDRG